MDYTIFLISLLSAVTSTEAIDLHSFTCSSAKEGGQGYVTLKWYDVTTVKVKKDGRDILICMSNQKHCKLFQPFGPNVRLSQSKDKDKDGLITLVIQIHRATRKGANPTSGVWTLAQVGSHNKHLDANCIVYEIADTVDCQYQFLNDKMNVNCNTSGTIPEALCHFKLDTMNTERLKVKVHHEIASRYCSAVIDLPTVRTRELILQVGVYPNLTGTAGDRLFGRNTSYVFNLEKTSISCSPTVEGGTSYIDVKLDSNIPVDIYKEDTLVFRCHKSDQCEPNNSISLLPTHNITRGKTNIQLSIFNTTRLGRLPIAGTWNLKYFGRMKGDQTSCLIFEKPRSVQCYQENKNYGVNLICHLSYVYPLFKCQFTTLNKHNLKTHFGDITYSHVLTSSDPIYHNMSCSVNISWVDLTSDRVQVSVSMYANVSGINSDTEEGSVKQQMYIDVPSLHLKDCPARVERGATVHCICSSNLKDDVVSWFEERNQQLLAETVLNYTAVNSIAFRCQLSASKRSSGIHQIFNPIIAYPPTVRKVSEANPNETNSDTGWIIECDLEGIEGQNVELVRRDAAITWASDDFSRQWRLNNEHCQESKYFECVMSATDHNRNASLAIQYTCNSHQDSRMWLIFVYVGIGAMVAMSFAVIVVAVYCKTKREKARKASYSYQGGVRFENSFYTGFEIPTETGRNSVLFEHL
ncbi:hypothetical protein BgiBS90_019415 [Biomphalaria glabrata]|nr:hypothetical protein BgiBS90_019415 [Biomphalaria glabrata]